MKDTIEKLRFQKYKSFSESVKHEIDVIKPICLVIGRNSSGKSSVIDILEFVFNSITRKRAETTFIQSINIELGLTLTENHLSAFNSKFYTGPLSNPYEIARQFIGRLVWSKFNGYDNWLSSDLNMVLNLSSLEMDSGPVDIVDYHTWDHGTWDKVVQSYSQYLKNFVFRRITAERDIVPESERAGYFNAEYNGDGTTNLLRAFLNERKFDEKLVENLLLNELNIIMGKDAHFESIRVQEDDYDGEQKWEIFLKEPGQERFALSKSGSGLKTILLMLVNLHLIPKLEQNKGKSFVYAFEELENNLHPALQRRVFEYLYSFTEKNDVRIFLTSHSHVAINVLYGKENACIYHVTKENKCSSIKPVGTYFDKIDILEDLDVKASDILQSNGIIWVEGPSDRIYIKRWLEVFTDNQFVEGRDYQFLYYGGKLLSHYELGGEESVEDLISILTTNRNAAIVIDSDKKYSTAKINDTKRRVKEEFEKQSFMCWITQGKEIENYLTVRSINQAFRKKLKKDVGRYELFPEYIKKIDANFSNRKTPFAKFIAPFITNEDEIMDVKKRILELYQTIEKWNK